MVIHLLIDDISLSQSDKNYIRLDFAIVKTVEIWRTV